MVRIPWVRKTNLGCPTEKIIDALGITCSRPHYRGRSVCVYPADRYQCHPGFYKSRYNLDGDGIARFARSARKGCFAGYGIRADSVKKAGAISPRGGLVSIGESSVFGRSKAPR